MFTFQFYHTSPQEIPYARHHKPLLRCRSWIQAIHKDRIFWKNLLKNQKMVFGNGVKNMQAAAYNGVRTVYNFFLRLMITFFLHCGTIFQKTISFVNKSLTFDFNMDMVFLPPKVKPVFFWNLQILYTFMKK